MARFLVWSDLHDEFWGGFDLPDLSAPVDGLLIAGDTHTLGRHLEIPERAARKYGCPVVVIWGNHELYGSFWSELLVEEERQLAALHAEGLDIRVLHHGAVTEIAGVRIIGATLWTDLKLFPELEDLAWGTVPDVLNDYQMIGMTPKRMFCVRTMLDYHALDKQAIWDALRKPRDGPTVVMTHHIPARQLVDPARQLGDDKERALCAGFASNLWSEIKGFNIHTWICGHSHEGQNWKGKGKHGPIQFIMNQRGYPGEEAGFDPAFVLEL